MATTRWNDREDELLQYLPHRAQVLYLRGLRRWMDYVTGVVGVSRGISIQQMVELLEVGSAYTGRNREERVTPRQVRTMIEQLERVGLIERMEGRRISSLVSTLVFRLPLADVDSSVQNSDVTATSQRRHTSGVTSKSSAGEACDGIDVTAASQRSHASGVTPPVSGIRNTSSPVVVDVKSIGADRKKRPTTVAEWFEFFGGCCGVVFEQRKVHTAKNAQMFDGWVRRGICVVDVVEAMELAHGRLDGDPPDSPAYYGWAVDAVLESKTEVKREAGRAGYQRKLSGAEILAAGCASAFE